MRAFIGIILGLVVGWFLVAYYGFPYYEENGPCGKQRVWPALLEIERIVEESRRVHELWRASDYPDNISYILQGEIEILEKARQLDVPFCLRGVKYHLVTALENLVVGWRGYIEYPWPPENFDVIWGSVEMNLYMADQEMSAVEKCVPYCEPIILEQILP